MVIHRVGSKCLTLGILSVLVCLTACANSYYINEPICVAYIHHDKGTKDVKWFTGEYARIYREGFLDGLTGYVWGAKQSEKLFDKDKEHLPWGYYYVDLELDSGVGYYLKGMAVGNCIFVWPNSLSDREFESLK